MHHWMHPIPEKDSNVNCLSPFSSFLPVCTITSCVNGGICCAQGMACVCPPGFTGERCEKCELEQKLCTRKPRSIILSLHIQDLNSMMWTSLHALTCWNNCIHKSWKCVHVYIYTCIHACIYQLQVCTMTLSMTLEKPLLQMILVEDGKSYVCTSKS